MTNLIYSLKIREFLSKQPIEHYINSNDWDAVYWAWTIETEGNEVADISELTDLLLEAKIDFLKYMSYVPLCCFKGLTLLDEDNLKTIHLSDKIVRIEEMAFYDTEGIETIYIPKSVKRIDSNAFNNSKIKRIIYEGKDYQWNKLVEGNFIIPTIYITCEGK